MREVNFIAGDDNGSCRMKAVIKVDYPKVTVVSLIAIDKTYFDDLGQADVYQSAADWSAVSASLLSHSPDNFANRRDWTFATDGTNTVVTNVPGQAADECFEALWRCTIDVSKLGSDEWCDYTMVNLTTRLGGAELVGVRSRLAESRIMKADGERYRAHGDLKHVVCLYVPFAGNNFDNVTMDILTHGDFPPLIEGATIDNNMTVLTHPKGHVWNTRFWRVEQTSSATVAVGGFVDIPLHLEWTLDDTACSEITTLKIEPVTGYATSTRVTTDANGQAVCRVGALGLVAGDVVKMKVNGHLMQNLGVLTATVT